MAEQKIVTAEDYRRHVAEEYGVYEAVEAIFFDNARAFNRGDRVPKSHVERGLVRLDQVRKLRAAETEKGA